MKKDSAKSDEREKPDPEGSGEEGTGQNSGDKGELRTGIVPHLVERATALRGQSIAHPRQSQSVLRRQTQSDIYGKDPEIPYVKFEAAIRNLVCSLMERQDRMNEEIFNRINDLGYRLDDLEQDRPGDGGGR